MFMNVMFAIAIAIAMIVMIMTEVLQYGMVLQCGYWYNK
jgi:hypothetical protein